MELLQIIYWTANALAGLSLFGALCVVLMHIRRMRREHREQAHRQLLAKQIMRDLQNPGLGQASITLMRQYPEAAAKLLKELTELISGSQRELLLGMALKAGLDRWLMDEMRSRKLTRRRAVVETLGLFHTPATLSALHTMLDDRAAEIRISAALALANLNAAPPILELVQKLNIQSRYRPRVLRRLFAKIAPEHTDDILAIAEGRLGPSVLRPTAIEAIGKIGKLNLADRIAALGDDPDIEVRIAVLRAIASLGTNPERDIIAAGLADDAWEVRVQAIQAARKLERFDLAPRIAMLVHDESWWVKLRANEALSVMQYAGVDVLHRLVEAGGARRPQLPGLVATEPEQTTRVSKPGGA